MVTWELECRLVVGLQSVVTWELDWDVLKDQSFSLILLIKSPYFSSTLLLFSVTLLVGTGISPWLVSANISEISRELS